MMGFPFFHMGFGWLWMGLPVLGAILLAIWLFGGVVRRPIGCHGHVESSSSARQILDERYARGEVTREEYERVKTDLASR